MTGSFPDMRCCFPCSSATVREHVVSAFPVHECMALRWDAQVHRGDMRGAFSAVELCVHLYRFVHEQTLLCAASLGLYHRRGISLHMRTRSVGTNDRILKVSAVQAPSRTDSHRGFLFLRIAKRIEDHKSATPLTGHVGFSWSSSPVFS